MSNPSGISITATNSHRSPSPFTSSIHGGAAPSSPLPAMKKAKSQAVAYSHDTSNFNSTSMIDVDEEDPTNLSRDVVLDPNSPTSFSSNVLSRASCAANLSRKNITPPPPQKKLVIKLIKGTRE